jgi:hypothetical protein
MEEDLNTLGNGRQPQYSFGEWKTTKIVWKVEDNLNWLRYGRKPQSFVKLRIISILENRRQLLYFGKQKTTSIFGKLIETGIQTYFLK